MTWGNQFDPGYTPGKSGNSIGGEITVGGIAISKLESPSPVKSKTQWNREFEDAISNRHAILDRLQFHGGLHVDTVTKESGLCKVTVLRHFRKLVENGDAFYTRGKSQEHIKPTPKE